MTELKLSKQGIAAQEYAAQKVAAQEIAAQEIAGELLNGISIVHLGKVSAEYFMTKGHFHTVLDTAEMYFCLSGQDLMVMENPDGDWVGEPLNPGRVL